MLKQHADVIWCVFIFRVTTAHLQGQGSNECNALLGMEEDGEMADHAALVVSDQTRVGVHEEISRSRPPRWPTTEEKTTPRTHFFPLKKHVLGCKKYPQGARIKPCFMSNALPLKWMIGAASFGLAMDQNLMVFLFRFYFILLF